MRGGSVFVDGARSCTRSLMEPVPGRRRRPREQRARPARMSPRAASRTLATCLLVVAVLGPFRAGLASGSVPAPAVLSVNAIAAQPLSTALTEFGRQSGLQFVYVAHLAAGVTTPGTPTPLGADQALTALLTGTGLQYEFLNERTVRLFSAHAAPPLPPPPAALVPEAVAQLPPVTVTGSRVVLAPRYAPASAQERATLERAAHDIEQSIERNHLLYARPALDHYLDGVLARLLSTDPPSVAGQVRIRVIRDAGLNAFALPNGSIYVTTELLIHLESEAELACVLGHEIAHFTNDHELREMRLRRRNEAVLTAVFTLLEAALEVGGARRGVQPQYVNPGTALPRESRDVWARASVVGYSQPLELEADFEGLRRMAAADYDAGEGLTAFEHLALSTSDSRTTVRAHFVSQIQLAERMVSYRALVSHELADAIGPPNAIDRERYLTSIWPVRLDHAERLIESRLLERAERVIDGYLAEEDSARAEFLKGEIARHTQPQSDDLERRALEAYARASELADPPPATFRQQGILYRRRGEREAAVAAFQRYLGAAPAAADAPLVRLYLESLSLPTAPAADP